MSVWSVLKIIGNALILNKGKTEHMATYTYTLPYALHVPTLNSAGAVASGTDGNGQTVTGNERPLLDTLIGICNPSATTQNVRYRFYKQDGTAALWGDSLPYRDYSLAAGHSVALTLIPGNPFNDPPQNFIGYATVEVDADMPCYSLIGGGGFYPASWNTVSANVPVYRSLTPATQWRFGYAIPYFNDYNHADGHSYRTELAIVNVSNSTGYFWVTYTVADLYGVAGTQYTFKVTIPAGQSMNYDMYTQLLTAGYTPTTNSEGWILVESRTSTSAGAPLTAIKAVPVSIVWNRDKTVFSGGNPMWQ